jgi:hypothetical protein
MAPSYDISVGCTIPAPLQTARTGSFRANGKNPKQKRPEHSLRPFYYRDIDWSLRRFNLNLKRQEPQNAPEKTAPYRIDGSR